MLDDVVVDSPNRFPQSISADSFLSSIDPGVVATDSLSAVEPSEDRSSLSTPFRPWFRAITELTITSSLKALSPVMEARLIRRRSSGGLDFQRTCSERAPHLKLRNLDQKNEFSHSYMTFKLLEVGLMCLTLCYTLK